MKTKFKWGLEAVELLKQGTNLSRGPRLKSVSCSLTDRGNDHNLFFERSYSRFSVLYSTYKWQASISATRKMFFCKMLKARARCVKWVFLFQQMGFPSRMQQPGVGQPSGQNQFLQQNPFPAASPGMNAASMPMAQPGNQTPVSQVSLWFLEVASVGSISHMGFIVQVCSNGEELVFLRCCWSYSQLNSCIETQHFLGCSAGNGRGEMLLACSQA